MGFLVTNLAKFFDIMSPNVDPIVGARAGHSDEDHLTTHIEGFLYTLPLAPWLSNSLAQLLAIPQGMI